MNLAVLATVFGAVFVAELPDKTALASLMLGTRYRAAYVFAGVAAAFVLHVVLAVSAGSLLFLLPHRLTQGVVAGLFAVGAALMLRRHEEHGSPAPSGAEAEDAAEPGADWPGSAPAGGDRPAPADPGPDSARGGVLTLPRLAAHASARPEPGPKAAGGFWKVAARSFAVLFVAEFGDLTQLATANLTARYHDPVTVGIGAVLGLWAVAALAITGGRQLLRVVPFAWITRAAAVAMAALAVVSLVAAITY